MKTIIKKLVLLVIVAFFAAIGYAQVPEGFNFQAVARDANGNLLTNQALGIKVSILKGIETGSDVYFETHSATTNASGLIQLVIGEGLAAEGQSFSAIDFSNDNYFVKLAIDPAGGTDYADLGTTRLLSVPYALVAKNVVNGGGGPGEAITNYNLNTSAGDTSFNISATGTNSILGALQVRSSTDGSNRGVDSRITTSSGNESSQLSIYGRAQGQGSGSHIGVYGIGLGSGGGNNIGTYGYALGTGKYNHGVYAVATGEGSGEIVPIGQEVDNNFGSYNVAGGFYSSGNLNGNVGIEAQTSGENGSRMDFGVISRAIGTSNSPNIGVRAEAFNSPVQNVALEGAASGAGTKNLGLRLNVVNGASNIGIEVNADTAAILNGHSIINGDLTVNGNIFGSLGSGSANGQTLDSLFISTKPEVELQRSTAFYPGYMRLQDSNGSYSIFSRSALQYGDTDSEGTGFVYNWYSKGGMQVANPDYLNGEKSAGMNGGYFYMDIAKNENFYVPLKFGIENAAEGGKSWFEMSTLKREEDGKGSAFRLSITNDPDGNDPTGEAAEMFLWGTDSPNFQIGGQQWENTNLGFLSIYGSTGNGDGWYHSNIDMSVQSNSTDEWGILSLRKTNIIGQTNQETILLDGNVGDITISGNYNQSSDMRLKKDILTLDNALENTLKMRGVSYTWKTDINSENSQIGVIAQEVEKIYPEFVHTDEDGMKSVNYAQMTAVLIEAVKTLNSEIQELKAGNATLQAKIDTQNDLNERLTKIEGLLQNESILLSLAKVSADK